MLVCVAPSSVSVWSVNKKKPLSTVKLAHGSFGEDGLEQPHWVASVAALQNSDTVASGASSCEILSAYTHTQTDRPLREVGLLWPPLTQGAPQALHERRRIKVILLDRCTHGD